MNIATHPNLEGRVSQISEAQVVIVGGGLAGSLAAIVLGRAGYSVKVVDPYETAPPEFRVEKFAGDQIRLLQQLGLHDAIARIGTPFSCVTNIRGGRLVDISRGKHFGILYQDIVNTVRREIPTTVDFVVGHVTDIETTGGKQRIQLKNGDVIESRLIILATGLRDTLRHKLGIERRILFKKQSLTFGFDIAPKRDHFNFQALTCYGSRPSDCIDYFNIFPIGDAMRANLFTFRDNRDPWAKQLLEEPVKALLEAMPGLDDFTGEFEVTSKIQSWTMDLTTVDNYLQDGIVLVGDAFQTSCPAAGLGASRAMVDIDRLCSVHIPRWLSSTGMGRDKIEQFYADPVKRDFDKKSVDAAHYRRSLTVNEGLGWTLHRHRKFLTRRLVHLVDQINPGWVARARMG